MTNTETLQVTTPSEREIVMTRVFDAPRSLVFDAWTKPELLERWLGVRNGWSFAVCEVDLRVGGAYRFVWRGPDGAEMGMGGVYREIVAPERLVSTEKFDEPWYPGEALDMIVLVEQEGKTIATTTVLYESQEIRDAVLESGMTRGVSESYDVLDELLESAGA
jgi:uncharacterized protein YndB with AHSA1/START domain